MRMCPILAHFRASLRHITCESIRAGHTVTSHYARTHQGHAPACHVTNHLILATLVLYHAHAVQIQRWLASVSRRCEVQSAPSKRQITPHRPRHARECELGCSVHFASNLSVCFH
ncbi:hypothetical protein Hdeb2414_s0002g00049531 [Helianthus debilis subsp. tardiflorus]